MISTKGKRKLEYENQTFYWYIKKDENGSPRIHILSEDKKLQLKFPFDREIGIGTGYIIELLEKHLGK